MTTMSESNNLAAELSHLEDGSTWMADAGILTIMMFDKGYTMGKDNTLIEFMDDPEKVEFFKDYYKTMARIAVNKGFGIILETTVTRKASQSRANNILNLTTEKWKDLIKKCLDMMEEIKNDILDEAQAEGKFY